PDQSESLESSPESNLTPQEILGDTTWGWQSQESTSLQTGEKIFQRLKLLSRLFEHYLDGRDVSSLAFLTQNLGADPDFLDIQFALEESSAYDFDDIYSVTY